MNANYCIMYIHRDNVKNNCKKSDLTYPCTSSPPPPVSVWKRFSCYCHFKLRIVCADDLWLTRANGLRTMQYIYTVYMYLWQHHALIWTQNHWNYVNHTTDRQTGFRVFKLYSRFSDTEKLNSGSVSLCLFRRFTLINLFLNVRFKFRKGSRSE